MKKAKWTSAIMGVPHAMRLVICFSALSLIFLFVLHTLAGSVLLNNTSSHSFESLVLCCSWVLGILGAQELNTFRGCLLEILTDWADCLPWTPISVNRGAQRALKMGLTLLELLPMVVPRNLWEKTLKLHKVSYLPCIPIWDRQTG